MEIEKKKIIKRVESYIGDLKNSDAEIIELYADTLIFYQKMRDELADGKLMMEHTNKGGATNIVKNPLAIEMSKTVQTLNNLLKSMGLTPSQRKEVTQEDERVKAFRSF